MPAYTTGGLRARRSSFIALVIATAVLYLAADVLIPLAIAILLAFLAAPAVRCLERWKLPRVAATALVAAVGFGLIFGIGAIAATQAVSLAAKLPEYRHNIAAKIHALRHPDQRSAIGKATEAIKDIERQAAPERPPMPVKETPATAFEAFALHMAPVAKPLAMALAVIVFTILLLIDRENMRERLVGLLGSGRINAMTRATAEASDRVARYLATQVVVNAMFGIPFGLALYLIGIPNALLFGLLGMVLRFVPYAGVWLAGAMPAVLAFAISDSWTPVLWTVGVFGALEVLLAYVVEPWLYSRSVGLSPVAIIAAVMFWTWLWGPIGLLLATPLTVCVAVIGRHIPELGYLNLLLGVEPVLSPEQRFYQRLVSLDLDEAGELAEKHAAAHGFVAALDDMLVPALGLVGVDRRKGTLEPARERFVLDGMRRVAEELDAPGTQTTQAGAPCRIVPAHDEADRVAALMLARAVAGRVTDLDADDDSRVIVVSAAPPQAASHAGYASRRLRSKHPDARIVAALWAEDDLARPRERLEHFGIDAVVSRIADAIKEVQKDPTRIPADGGVDRPAGKSARKG